MWSCSHHSDPLQQGTIIEASCSVKELCRELEDAVHEEYVVRTAVADFFARHLSTLSDTIESLDVALRSKRHRSPSSSSAAVFPYVLERSDAWCSNTHLHLIFRVKELSENGSVEIAGDALKAWNLSTDALMTHVACCVLQHRIRLHLRDNKFVAFIARGAILPRKSGVSHLPMASPPAVPFEIPSNSDLDQTIIIEMGSLKRYCSSFDENGMNTTTVTLRGMAVPVGITLICGGGYHGKSTLLRTIAAGVYNKVPGDGRELCVTVEDAVSVRAEDGRYVNNCNVGAFISNLPTLPGVTTQIDTKRFSTREASGSTSQAANVSEAIEMGATAMLVDEDVSAANFMARDGRMRALVMDESITPLLYRVNGLFTTHRISSVVVVGGVGDWLDVPHKVILLDKYEASDATEKAKSISRQFSYGHVQYAGRGVVHRLEWDKEGTPIPRRPTSSSVTRFGKKLSVSLVEGGNMLCLEQETDLIQEEMHENDDLGFVDMSRCEQLVGKKAQLFGCGLCVSWIIQQAHEDPKLGIAGLLKKLEQHLMSNGMHSLVSFIDNSTACSVGFVYRPRKHEIYMALTRLRGITFEEMPVEDDDEEAAAAREAERRKEELKALWNARRKKNRFD